MTNHAACVELQAPNAPAHFDNLNRVLTVTPKAARPPTLSARDLKLSGTATGWRCSSPRILISVGEPGDQAA
jgi:hypothetical protein